MLQATKLFTVFIACVVSSCATSDSKQYEAYERELVKTRAALIARGDADSVAAAALMSSRTSTEDDTRLNLLARASAIAPTRANLSWLYLQQCIAIDACNPKPIETQLHSLDPGNAAAWLGSLSRESRSADANLQQHIAAMAHSESLDIYWNPTIVDLTNATMKVRTMDLPSALVGTIGSLAAVAIPAYSQLSNSCKGDVLRRPDVLENCRKLAAVLRHGDTYITEMIGIAIARRVWPESSDEYKDAIAAARVAHYRMEMESKLSTTHLKNIEGYRSYLALLTTHQREQDALLADIVNAGVNPNPPSVWEDPLSGDK